MEATSGKKWLEVNRSEPCAICAKPDWCKRSTNGKWCLCQRMESGRPGQSSGWLHALDGELRLPVIQTKAEAEPVIDWTVLAVRLRTNRTETSTSGNERTVDVEQERERLAARIGVTTAALASLWVGYGYEERYGKEQAFWSFPERNHEGRVVGIVRRIDKSGTGLADKKLSMKGGKGGVYYEPLWYTRKGPVFIAEGGSDTAALVSMGLAAIGRPSCTGGVRYLKELLAKYKKPVIVLGERDEQAEKRGTVVGCPLDCEGCLHCFPGKKGAIVVAAQLSLALKRSVEIVFPPAGFKDVRDWYRSNPTAKAVDWLGAIEGKGKA